VLSSDLGVEMPAERIEDFDALIVAVRAELDAARVLEHRAVTLGALIDASGARYLSRATSELEAAFDALRQASSSRSIAAARVTSVLGLSSDASLGEIATAATFPYDAALASVRAELIAVRQRLATITESNTIAIGRRLALVDEALRAADDEPAGTYGRPTRSPARIVRGVL
jgi:hypothetical protein